MKLSVAFAGLLVLLVLLDAPSPADAQRCVRRRWQCNRFGGVRRFCRIRQCARQVCRRARRGRRGRGRGRRNCFCRRWRNIRGFLCRRETVRPRPPIFEPPLLPVDPPVPAPGFCQERCFPTWRAANFGCNRQLCFIRRCPGTNLFHCTAGAVPEIPGPRLCYGGCQVNRFRRRPCNANFCILQRCDARNPNRFSCVPKLVTTVPPATTAATTRPGQTTQATVPTTTPVQCRTACQTAQNGRIAFLTVVPTCRNPACKIVFCKVAERDNTFGYACVGATTPGTRVTQTPLSTQTLVPTTTVVTSAPTTAAATTAAVTTAAATTAAATTAAATTAAATTAAATTAPATTQQATTATTTLPPGVVSAAEWDRCTITRGGSRSRTNSRPAPNGNPINVDVTVINEGVVNLACKTSQVSLQCNTDGSITVSIEAAQAAVLDVNKIYPIDAVFAVDRTAFSSSCVLNRFPLTANPSQQTEAERLLRQRASTVKDVYLKITSVSGTARTATIRGRRVSAMAMFSSARIFNLARTSRTVSAADYESSMSMMQENPAVRQLFDLNKDRFQAQIRQGSTTAIFNGQLDSEGNRIETINLQVTAGGSRVNSRYVVRRRYDVQYSLNLNNAGDSAIRRTAEPLALSTIRTGFPDVQVTPITNPPVCCNLPDLRFEEFFEIRPYLTVGSNAGGKISALAYNFQLRYPQQDITIEANGDINNPVVSISPLAVAAPSTAALTAATAVSINPVTQSPFLFNINAGMTPSLSLFLPTVVGSLQQKANIQFDTRSGTETGVLPVTEDAPSDNGQCAAAHNLRINTLQQVLDSQFVSLSAGDVQGTIGARTTLIPGMNTPRAFVRNDCFFP